MRTLLRSASAFNFSCYTSWTLDPHMLQLPV